MKINFWPKAKKKKKISEICAEYENILNEYKPCRVALADIAQLAILYASLITGLRTIRSKPLLQINALGLQVQYFSRKKISVQKAGITVEPVTVLTPCERERIEGIMKTINEKMKPIDS